MKRDLKSVWNLGFTLCTLIIILAFLSSNGKTLTINFKRSQDVDTKDRKEGLCSDKTVCNTQFKNILTPVKVCDNTGPSSDPFLLIIVKSNVRNLDYRMAIRYTWGSISDSAIKVIFSLGYSPFLQDFIQKESSMFNDILQDDFIDHYNNNTLKMVMSFNWCVTQCLNTKYFYFVDDDYLVNVKNLFQDLRARDSTTDIFVGRVWEDAIPVRNISEKWYISKTEFPDEVFPPYATGGSFVISYGFAKRMKNSFKNVKPIYIDDVYLGIVARHLNITLTNNSKFDPKYRVEEIHNSYSIHNFQSAMKLVNDWQSLKSQMDLII